MSNAYDDQPAVTIAENERFLSMTLGELRAQMPNAVRASEALLAGTITEQPSEAIAEMFDALQAFQVLYAILQELEDADPTQIMPVGQLARINAVLAGEPDPLPTPADR